MNRAIITAIIALILTAIAQTADAQSESSYDLGFRSPFGDGNSEEAAGPTAAVGFFDPSRLTVNHAVSFYAGGSQISDMKSQSVYSTMLQYRFNAPVVFSLNFDMPIHSTFNQYNNFTTDNLSSLEYFRNMPFDASVTWHPSENFMLRVSMIRMPESAYFHNGFYRSDRFFRPW